MLDLAAFILGIVTLLAIVFWLHGLCLPNFRSDQYLEAVMTIDTQKLREYAAVDSFDSDDVNSLLDHIDAQSAEIAQARQTADYWKAEHNAANAEIARLREALSVIADYWNRDQNDQAMHDACWHAINTANAALSGEPT